MLRILAALPHPPATDCLAQTSDFGPSEARLVLQDSGIVAPIFRCRSEFQRKLVSQCGHRKAAIRTAVALWGRRRFRFEHGLFGWGQCLKRRLLAITRDPRGARPRSAAQLLRRDENCLVARQLWGPLPALRQQTVTVRNQRSPDGQQDHADRQLMAVC